MKYLLQEATPAEEEQVGQWLNADASNLAYYNGLKATWEASRRLAAVSEANEDKAWERFREKIHQSGKPGKRVRGRRFGPLSIAASVILAIGLGIGFYFVLNRGSEPIPMIVASQDFVITDTFPDGSVVTLNKNSSITYPSSFHGNTRNVQLIGEAFFDVTPDKKKPFIISVLDLHITVLGTSFNVKSGKDMTEVTVETGTVKVTRSGQAVKLHAHERLVVSAKDTVLVKEEVEDRLYNYYRTKEFVCDDTPLWKLAEVLAGAYHVHIIFARNELGGLKINTTFNNESLEQVLDVISLTFGLTITRNGDTITLQ